MKALTRNILGLVLCSLVVLLIFYGLYNKTSEKKSIENSIQVSIIDKINSMETKISSIDGKPVVQNVTRVIDNTVVFDRDKLKNEIISDLVKSKVVEDCLAVYDSSATEWTYTCHSTK